MRASGLRGLPAGRNRRRLLAAIVATAGPAAVTLLAIPDAGIPATTPALLYVLVVVLASAVGGAIGGLVASAVSFLLLNFFFTPPLHTFSIAKTGDLLALVVFLLVSVITGLLLSISLKQKERAERREVQTRLMNRFSSKLLSGLALEEVLEDFGRNLTTFFGLSECEIETVMSRPVKLRANPDVPSIETHEFELSSAARKIGVLRVAVAPPKARLEQEEEMALRGFADQLALALESARLSSEVKAIQFDAETSRLRAALFSSVTHDLKTPLSAITASVTSMLDGPGFSIQERNEHLETIRLEAEHLNRVVTNLMDLSRMRAGALTPSKVPAPIDELIEAVIGRLQPMLDGRIVSMSVREDLAEVPMDLVQLDQVLTNLLENAVKFSPPGSPIRVSAVGSPTTIRVTVEDRGPGISKDDRDRIFEPFERGLGGAAGTGLGLAIAKAVITAHGGRIWAGAAPGGGAAMTFELPIDPHVGSEVGDGTTSLSR
jgi:two-component system, OmpR family, sensor histidine kinase KdpD